jgi:hypothetical protein
MQEILSAGCLGENDNKMIGPSCCIYEQNPLDRVLLWCYTNAEKEMLVS